MRIRGSKDNRLAGVLVYRGSLWLVSLLAVARSLPLLTRGRLRDDLHVVLRIRTSSASTVPQTIGFESAPVAEQDSQIRRPDVAVTVQISGAIIAVGAWPPTAQQNGQVERANTSVAIEITRSFATVVASIRQDRNVVAAAIGRGHVEVIVAIEVTKSHGERIDAKVVDGLEMQKLRLPEDHPVVASALNLLGRILAESGQCERAEPLLRQSLTIRQERLPRGHWQTIRTQDLLAQCAVVQERYDEAEKLFREIRALRLESPLRHAPHDPKFQLDHGSCLLKLERFEEAELLLLESYEAFTTAGGDSSAGAQSALRRRVELYEAWAKPDDAAKYRALLASLDQTGIPQPLSYQSE